MARAALLWWKETISCEWDGNFGAHSTHSYLVNLSQCCLSCCGQVGAGCSLSVTCEPGLPWPSVIWFHLDLFISYPKSTTSFPMDLPILTCTQRVSDSWVWTCGSTQWRANPHSCLGCFPKSAANWSSLVVVTVSLAALSSGVCGVFCYSSMEI